MSTLAVVVWLAAGAVLPNAGREEGRPLRPEAPLEGAIRSGETHAFRVRLAAGDFVRVVVEQHDVDLVVTLSAADGEKLATMNSETDRQLPETLAWVAVTTGDHVVEVVPAAREGAAGRYVVRLAERRKATARDRSRVAGQAAYASGAALQREGTADSRRKALAKYQEALASWREAEARPEEARTLHGIGRLHELSGEYKEALESYRAAIDRWRALGDQRGEGLTTHNLGAVHFYLGRYQEALDLYNRALPLRRAAGDRLGEAYVLSAIGTVHSNRSENEEALAYLHQALPLFRALENRGGEGLVLHNIGKCHYLASDYPQARVYLNQALEARRSAGDRQGEAQSLSALGQLHLATGEYRKALDYFYQALPMRRLVGDRRGEAYTLNDIGSVHMGLGEYQKALEYLRESLALRRAIGDRDGESFTFSVLGRLYAALGDAQKALDYHAQALALARTLKNPRVEAGQLDSMGALYMTQGQHEKAIETYVQALSVRKAFGDRDGPAPSILGLSKVWTGRGEHQKALDALAEARPFVKGDRPREALVVAAMADAHAAGGQLDQALSHYASALDLLHDVGQRAAEARALASIARVHSDQGNLLEARKRIEASLDLIESMRDSVVSVELRSSHLASSQEAYGTYIDVLMKLEEKEPSRGHAAAALQVAERARARGLLETLVDARADVRQGADPVLLDRERALQQELNARADGLTRLLGGRHTTAQADAARKEIDALVADYRQVRADIRARSPRYAALTQPVPLSADEIQKQVLDAETVLLEYALGEERSTLWSVTSSSLQGYRLPPRAEIEAAARRVYELMTAPDPTLARAPLRLAARRLSRMVLGPARAQLARKRLLIVADGALQYIPFAALPMPASTGNGRLEALDRPLVADHEIVSIPSASVLAILRRELSGRARAAKAVAVVADPVLETSDRRIARSDADTPAAPTTAVAADDSVRGGDLMRAAKQAGVSKFERLPFSREEADAITALAGPETLKALDFDASRATLIDPAVARYRILHIATHALMNSEQPELSGIVLSLVTPRGEPQDGFLRLHDIYNLRLEAELVVLSACQTALGKEIKGEGLIGLTRGFMYAGVPRVVASLWNVRDRATAELMKRFYASMLRDGLRPASALRAAQLSMSKDPRWASPHYWGGFVLQGDWR